MSTPPLFVRVPDALKQALAARAREGGLSLTAAAVALLERGLDTSEEERARERPLDEIRLTLTQFGCSTDWSDVGGTITDPFKRVIRSIESAPDETLVKLDEYLFGEPAGADTSVANEIWPTGFLRLFISHTSTYKREVSALALLLESQGIHGFVAHEDIEPTREWQEVIESALATCDALAAYLSADFVTSKWCDQEVGFGVGRAIPIVPLKFSADPHGFIGKYQALPCSGKIASAIADEVADALLAHPQTAASMAVPAVHAFARADSFANARTHWERIKRIPATRWTTDMALEATNAARTNTQLSLCGVPEGDLPTAVESFLQGIFQRVHR